MSLFNSYYKCQPKMDMAVAKIKLQMLIGNKYFHSNFNS